MPRVQVFETGANQWRSLAQWPDPRGEELVLYLDSARPLFGLAEAGRLVSGVTTSGVDGYIYDPAAARPEGRADLWTTTRVPLDQEQEDALFYASDPLASALELGGPGELQLWFATSARDTDFFVLVLDVEPSGAARALTPPSRMRMRYLAGWDTPTPLEPGRAYHARIELLPFAHRFDAGHRIGLFLCSEWFPEFDRNLNTGERIKDATRIVVAEQHVFRGADRPSSVRFRLLPPR